MRRRSLLAALAGGTAGLAGCSFGDSDPATVTPAPVPTQRPADAGPAGLDAETRDALSPGPAADVVELETRPRSYSLWPTRIRTEDDLTLVLRLVRPATKTSPAIIRGYLANTGGTATTVGLDRLPSVGRTTGRPRDGGTGARVVLAPTEAHELAESVPDVHLDGSGRWRLAGVGRWVPPTHRLDPGDAVGLEYGVVWGPQTGDPPPAIYEFAGRGGPLALSVWDTESPGPAESSRLAGLTVPPPFRHVKVQWYHRATAGTTLFLRPSRERLELDGSITFDLVNRNRETLRCGRWTLFKLVEGRWYRIASTAIGRDCDRIRPGERKRWTFGAATGPHEGCPTGDCPEPVVTRGYLGGGTYAAVANTGYPGGWTGAIIELDGPPVALAPAQETRVHRGETEIEATTLRYGAPPPWVAIALTRAESAQRRLIAEQVMGTGEFWTSREGLPTALALLADDVDRVVHWTDESAVDRALGGPDADRRRFSFRGQAYEATRVASDL